MTEAEKVLWERLRKKQLRGYQFYRQKPLAEFIVDFYCPAAKLVVEADGAPHFSTDGMARDKERDERLSALNLTSLRFSNNEILESTDTVIGKIEAHLLKI